jgi:hypothetical protein
LIFGGIAWIWLPVSNQELLANFSKAENFYRGFLAESGFPWWSPMFMQGTSLSFAWVFMATNLSLLVFSVPFGFFVGPKIATLFLIWFGSLGSFFFLRRYSGSEISGFVGGILFAVNPSILTRAVDFEHYAVLLPMAVLPWLLWSVVGFVRRASAREAILLGIIFSVPLLAYTKAGLMAFLVALVFGATEYFSKPWDKRPSSKLIFLAAAVVFVLAVVPNLPTLREAGFVAMFEFGPFEGWQRAFSTKSALSWFDRGGVLSAGMEAGFAPTTMNGGTYLGFVSAGVLVVALLAGVLHSSEIGRQARLMLVLALGMFWLSFGPRSVVGGHFEFLRLSAGAADFTPAIGWFLLGVQVWVLFQLVPPSLPYSRWVAGGVALVYLFVPGFRLLEWLPFFGNIRAPFDFYQVTGAVCMVAAVALAAGALLERAPAGWLRGSIAVVLAGLIVIDQGVYAGPMFRERMPQQVWEDFTETQEFLKSAPVAGRVYPFSGRYFYLMTPWLSGRALSAEAFNSYLQQRGVAILQGTAFLDDAHLKSFLRVSGAAYLLVDKSDPDTSQKMQERLRGLFPVAHENTNFVVLEVIEPLGAGFLASDFIMSVDAAPENALAALAGASHNLVMLEFAGAPAEMPGLQGRVDGGRIVQLEGRMMEEGRPFAPVSGGMDTYQSARFEPTGEAGWLVFNEAWHPDWRAYEEGKRVPVRRAMLAFSSVETSGTSAVVFRFEQPWWYDWCAWAGLAGWGCVLVGTALGWRRRGGE